MPLCASLVCSLSAQLRGAEQGVLSAVVGVVSRACALPPFPAEPIRDLPLVASPLPPLIFVASYLLVALLASALIRALRLQPRARDPWPLLLYVVSHNAALFALSAYLALALVSEATRLRYSLWGNAYKAEETRMAWLIYLFYMSKYIEFGDTLIMILRCSTRQISFLHVYHHSTITLIWWCTCFTAPGGDAYFSAALNSLVHVFMYGYYLLAALLPRHSSLRAKYLFWGRYLTQVQMCQFVLNVLQATYNITSPYSRYPACLAKLLLGYMCTLLLLFAHFYVGKYRSKEPSLKGKEE